MLGIQNQPQLSHSSPLSFKGKTDERNSAGFNYGERDSFNVEELKEKRKKAKDEIGADSDSWNDFADELENSDIAGGKKMGKIARTVAAAAGLAGTFVVSKYSSKIAIESLKSIAKSKNAKKAFESLKGVKEPVKKGVDFVKTSIEKLTEKPEVKAKLEALKNSKASQKVLEFMNNEKVKKVMEPFKNTIASIKNAKINGEKIQNAAENTMAGVTTGSVLVDNLTGRNNDKSAIELAAGSSGEV
ncbi:MAG: hypothetical protein LUB59_04060 [Candidatus Gastranaerophilales bacterium]|nr:hypothetical protein [Candidatus Gastranaerophilales bacterium]